MEKHFKKDLFRRGKKEEKVKRRDQWTFRSKQYENQFAVPSLSKHVIEIK
jgi:hypothetical protein